MPDPVKILFVNRNTQFRSNYTKIIMVIISKKLN